MFFCFCWWSLQVSSEKEWMGQHGEMAQLLPSLFCGLGLQSCQPGALLMPIYMELLGFFHHCWGTFSNLLAVSSRILFTICVVDAVIAE